MIAVGFRYNCGDLNFVVYYVKLVHIFIQKCNRIVDLYVCVFMISLNKKGPIMIRFSFVCFSRSPE